MRPLFYIAIFALLFAIVPVASADTGNFDPFGESSLTHIGSSLGEINTSSPGTGGTDSYGLSVGNTSQITTAGSVTVVQYGLTNVSHVTRFHILIWRSQYGGNNTSGNFTCIAKSENLASKMESDGVQTIVLTTPLTVQVGDYVGYESDAEDLTPSYKLISTDPVNTSLVTDAMIHHGINNVDGFNVSETFNFTGDANYHTANKTYRINLFTGTYTPSPTPSNGADPWANKSISQVAPYIGTMTYSAPATGGNDSYGINTGTQTRIRQNGNIKVVQFAVSNVDYITRFHVLIWRHDGTENTTSGTFTLVSKSENLVDKIGAAGIQNITLDTPIAALEGDYIGWESDAVNRTPSYYIITTSAVNTTITTDAVIHHGAGRVGGFDVGNQFDFVSSASLHTSNKIYRINVFMDKTDTAFIGDSVISGRTNHTSYVDPSTFWYPNSSMSYQWGLLSGRSYQNLGWRGQTTNQIRARFISDAVAVNPTNVIIEGGLNDHTSGTPKETTLANLNWMVNTAIINGIHPIVIEVPPSETYGALNDFEDWDWINAQLSRAYDNNSSVTLIHDRQYVGTASAVEGAPEGNLWKIKEEYDPGDHLHYNVAGFEEWGRFLALPYPALTYTKSGRALTFSPSGWNVNESTTFLWTFGDGTTSTAQNPTHAYASSTGVYTVSLVVSNDVGSTTLGTRAYVQDLTVRFYDVSSITEDARNLTTTSATGYTSYGNGLAAVVVEIISDGYSLGVFIIIILGAYGLLRYLGLL